MRRMVSCAPVYDRQDRRPSLMSGRVEPEGAARRSGQRSSALFSATHGHDAPSQPLQEAEVAAGEDAVSTALSHDGRLPTGTWLRRCVAGSGQRQTRGGTLGGGDGSRPGAESGYGGRLPATSRPACCPPCWVTHPSAGGAAAIRGVHPTDGSGLGLAACKIPLPCSRSKTADIVGVGRETASRRFFEWRSRVPAISQNSSAISSQIRASTGVASDKCSVAWAPDRRSTRRSGPRFSNMRKIAAGRSAVVRSNSRSPPHP